MKGKTRYKMAAAGLAFLLGFGVPGTALAFEPWSNVGGYWISADGRTPVKGAVGKGITVTKYQNTAGEINWKQVAREDISFAMIRLGYYQDADPYFQANMAGAESVGIDTGVCFYGKARDVEGARKEARYVLDAIKGYRVAYPVAYDVDSQELLAAGLTKAELTQQVEAFCKTIEEAGYKAAVFGDHEWLTRYLDMSKLPYDVWYSRYGLANSFENRTLWRCSDQGTVEGIKGNLCLEFTFEDYKKTFPGTGWRLINGKKYYFRNHRMTKSITLQIDHVSYSFDRNGIPQEVR